MDEEAQPSTFCPWQPKETPVINHAGRTWWRQAVVYHVHIRSFADRIGDIDPAFGTLAYAGTLIAEARRHTG
jgi:hypothetical protein